MFGISPAPHRLHSLCISGFSWMGNEAFHNDQSNVKEFIRCLRNTVVHQLAVKHVLWLFPFVYALECQEMYGIQFDFGEWNATPSV